MASDGIRHKSRWFKLLVGPALTALVPLRTVTAQISWEGGTSSSWNNPANWSSAAVPMSGDVYVNSSIGGGQPLLYDFSGSTTLDLLNLYGDSQDGNQLLSMPANLLSATVQTVGGYGVFNQSGGTNNCGQLQINGAGDVAGIYSLSNGNLQAGSELVGDSGPGLFNQTGGINNISSGTLQIGNSASSLSTYALGAAGTLLVSQGEFIDYGANAVFSQIGGANTIGHGANLYVGYSSGANGTYNLGAGSLSVGADLYVGVYGTANFDQTGGTNVVTGSLKIALGGQAANYTITGNSALALGGDMVIYGAGSFNQTGGSTNISGTIYNSGQFLETGSLILQGNFNNSGTAIFGGAEAWSPGSIFTNTAGKATFQTDAGSVNADLMVNASGGSLVFNSTQHLAGLAIGTGATSQVTNPIPGHASVIVTPALAVTGVLDLTTNALIVQGGDLATLTNLARQGYNNGAWNGPTGITSTSAASNSNHLTAIGVIQNNQSGSALFTQSTPFENITPGTSDILVKYTYYGDANLNGKIDGSDYSLIDNGYQSKLTGWYNGDFNYDNTINGSDYTLIDNAFNSQTAQLTDAVATSKISNESNTSAVPEPSALALIVIVTVPLSGRRKRR